MALDTSNAQYVIASAEMYIALGKLDEADGVLNSNRQNFQYNSAVRQTLGHVQMLRKQPVEAARTFTEARILAPDDRSVLEDLVRAQVASTQFAEAEVNLTKLIDMYKDKPRR